MEYQKLIKKTVNCIKSFNENLTGADSYCNEYLDKVSKEPHERMFIKQVFYGVNQYRSFFKVFTTKFFELNVASTERKDEDLYHIFLYLTLFRFEELPFEEYKKLVLSQDFVKINEFYTFLFNFEQLEKIIRPLWIDILDPIYIDNTLIFNLRKTYDKLADLIKHIELKAKGTNLNSTKSNSDEENSNSFEQISKKLTIPQPFNLTKPKARIIKSPIQIDHKFQFKPIPYEEFNKKNLEIIEEEFKEIKSKNYELTKQKYDKEKLFNFKTDSRPVNLPKIKEEVELKRKAELQFNNKYVTPLKNFEEIKADVRYNDAAIIREDFLLNKIQENEKKEIERMIAEKKDAKEFNKWKEEMEIKEEKERKEAIVKRKMMNELSKHVAQNTLQKKINENQLKVKIHKVKEEKKIEEKMITMKIELEERKKVVKEITTDRENLVEKKKELVEANQSKFNEQRQNYKEKVNNFNEEKKKENEKRMKIIKQIRLLESLPIPRSKGFDPTETVNHGILEQMSLVELKERLIQQKKFNEDYLQSKREENKIKNENKVEDLNKKALKIAMYRDKKRNNREIHRKKVIEERERKKLDYQNTYEENILNLKNKLEKKKKKIKKENEEFELKIREIKLQQQYFQQGRAQVEEKAFKQIEEGVERKINNTQNRDLVNQYKNEKKKVSLYVFLYYI